MKMSMNDQTGYEVWDAKSLCEEQHKEQSERLAKINGMYPYGMPGESDENYGGFLPRNNVRDRL